MERIRTLLKNIHGHTPHDHSTAHAHRRDAHINLSASRSSTQYIHTRSARLPCRRSCSALVLFQKPLACLWPSSVHQVVQAAAHRERRHEQVDDDRTHAGACRELLRGGLPRAVVLLETCCSRTIVEDDDGRWRVHGVQRVERAPLQHQRGLGARPARPRRGTLRGVTGRRCIRPACRSATARRRRPSDVAREPA